MARRGAVAIGAVKDGWLRTAEPFDKGKYGWLLAHGGKIGLGLLMAPLAALEEAQKAAAEAKRVEALT